MKLNAGKPWKDKVKGAGIEDQADKVTCHYLDLVYWSAFEEGG